MSGNTFGRIFRLTTFGESHGPALGGVVEGCPAGIVLDQARIQSALDRRRPGSGNPASTTRKEPDAVRLLSGIFEGKTTGTPIGFSIENTGQRSQDYGPLADKFRPGHADLGFQAKYGLRDPRGGGRSSGRETASRVAGGAIASAFLDLEGISVQAWTVELGGIQAREEDPEGAADRPFYAPSAQAAMAWEERITEARKAGDTLGGLVRVVATGVPAGLGEPVFDKLDARLAYALMGVGAVKGVEIGAGFSAAGFTGSRNNDPILATDKHPEAPGVVRASRPLDGRTAYGFASNHAGGTLGGISSGAPLVLTVAVKPIASIAQEQRTIDLHGNPCHIQVGGRHDICAIPRIVPVLEAMTALVLADFVLLQRAARV